MLYRQAVLAFVLAAFLFAPSAARGDDVDDLKATFEQTAEAINKRDTNALSAFWHDQLVDFVPNSPFPTDGKEAFRQGTQTFFDNHESVALTIINPQFRVIGTTGLTWGHYALALKPKDGPARTEFGRYTVTYVKSDGKWLNVARHLSLVPSGN